MDISRRAGRERGGLATDLVAPPVIVRLLLFVIKRFQN